MNIFVLYGFKKVEILMEKKYKVILCGKLYDGITEEREEGFKHE